jgi:hypothetical protein
LYNSDVTGAIFSVKVGPNILTEGTAFRFSFKSTGKKAFTNGKSTGKNRANAPELICVFVLPDLLILIF